MTHTVHVYVVGNFFSQVIFIFCLLLWMFSFVLHSLPSIATKESKKSPEKKITYDIDT